MRASQMTRAQTYISATLTVLSGIAVYCFFAFEYPYHLHFQEQYQLFESTWAYFGSVAAVPGGLADWLGRFLTQFCYHAPVGAALMTLLVIAVQLLTWAVCRKHTFTSYALSFLPAVTLLAFLCDESALAGGAVALILALAGAALCTLIRSDMVRWMIEAILVPILYLACGGIAVVFVLICLIREFARCGIKAWVVALVLIVLAALCPFVAARIFPYPLGRLCYGIHYYRFHNIMPGMLWTSALCSVLVAGICSFGKRERPSRWQWIAGSVLFVLLAALGVGLVLRTADWSREETMRYDFMARMEMWNRIMMRADVQNPQDPTALSCLNLALAKTGRMGDHQFSYYQDGTEGLLPGFVADFTGPVTTGEIFWHLGMVNTAQRFAFEAQEAIPDFQKSARCYKRLAQTNIVNGDWDVARKYLGRRDDGSARRRRSLPATGPRASPVPPAQGARFPVQRHGNGFDAGSADRREPLEQDRSRLPAVLVPAAEEPGPVRRMHLPGGRPYPPEILPRSPAAPVGADPQ